MGSQEMIQLRQENAALRRENEALRLQALRHTLERALGDDHFSREIVPQMGQFFPEPLGPEYVCILFHGRVPAKTRVCTVSPLREVEEWFSGILRPFGQPFFFETVGTIICLLNISQEAAAAFGPAISDAISDDLTGALARDQEGMVGQITISRPSQMEDGPRMLYRSTAVAFASRTPSSPPVCVADIGTAGPAGGVQKVFELEPMFWRQIQQHAFYDAAATLDQIIELTCLEHGTLDQVLASVFSRMETVLKTARQEQGPAAGGDVTEMLSDLSQAKTFQEIRMTAYDILATMEDRYYTPADTRNKKMPSIERYIGAHYADPDLGTASISEEFKISTSYLSRIFKADMGVSVTDYIHRVRIDAAKTLLRSSALTLDEIAARVGFSNRWVLIRVFKELTGITPSGYRGAAN